MGPIARSVLAKITEKFLPVHQELINESHMHSRGQEESHFRLILVTDKFLGLSRLERSRMVHELLDFELKNQIHALTMLLFTAEEWQVKARAGLPESPPCQSGSKEKTKRN